MLELMKEMMKSKGGKKKLSKLAKEAKMNVLGKIASDAEDEMSGKLAKVTVMAKDKEGLKKGLEMAEDKLGGEEDEVEMTKPEFKEEHDRLLDVLRSPSHEDDLEEADKQEDEMEEYLDEDEMGEDEEESTEDKIARLEEELERLKSQR